MWLAIVFSLELVFLQLLMGTEGLASRISASGTWAWRLVVGFAVLFIAVAWIKHRPALTTVSAEIAWSPISLGLLAGHLGAISVFCLLSSILLDHPASYALKAIWLAAGLSAVALGGFAFLRPAFWLSMVRRTGSLWVWAAVAAVLACLAGSVRDFTWPIATGVTFRLSQAVLSPFVSGLIIDPASRLIGTQRFSVEVAPECSGLEGIGLIAAFGMAWLVVFRNEFRFPRALILLPIGMAFVFAFNAVRIAALVLIGDAGGEAIATHGFHSTAGWIIFNLIALSFCLATSKVSWLRVAETPVVVGVESVQNPATRWVLPLLSMVAAGMLASAVTGDFEWFYPLRFFAVAVTVTVLWRRYTDLDWRVGWFAPMVGVVVFLLWIGLDRLAAWGPQAMPAALAAASPPDRNLWLVFRVLAVTVTVPIAEELAFRGFLYRFFLSPDFDSVSFRRFSWVALLASSIIYGLLHTDHWLVSTLAGALYALALVRRGSIGDAVVAHATTNALLTVGALGFHRWQLW